MTFRALDHRDGVWRFVGMERPPLRGGQIRIRVVAAGVNRADCLQAQGMYAPPPGASPILGLLRARWKAAKPADAAALASFVSAWQNAVWKFNHAGLLVSRFAKTDGPAAWLEAATPPRGEGSVTARQRSSGSSGASRLSGLPTGATGAGAGSGGSLRAQAVTVVLS